MAQKTTEYNVLEAAKSESKNIILVYANEKAMTWNMKPLPIPLEVRVIFVFQFWMLTNVGIRSE